MKQLTGKNDLTRKPLDSLDRTLSQDAKDTVGSLTPNDNNDIDDFVMTSSIIEVVPKICKFSEKETIVFIEDILEEIPEKSSSISGKEREHLLNKVKLKLRVNADEINEALSLGHE